MKKLSRLVVVTFTLFVVLFVSNAAGDQCSDAVLKAMKEAGLSDKQIKAICAKAETYAQTKSSVFTPAKIEKDIVGKTTSGGSGWIFGEGERRDIKVLDTKTSGPKAQVIIHMDTGGFGKQMSGRLRLHYELIAGRWELLGVENLSFKRQ